MKKFLFNLSFIPLIFYSCSKENNSSTSNNNSTNTEAKATVTMTVDGRSFQSSNAWGSYTESNITGQLVKSIGFANSDTSTAEGVVLSVANLSPIANTDYLISATSNPSPPYPNGDPAMSQFVYRKAGTTSTANQYLAGPLSEKGRLNFKITRIISTATTKKNLEFDFSGVLYKMDGSDSVVISNGKVRY